MSTRAIVDRTGYGAPATDASRVNAAHPILGALWGVYGVLMIALGAWIVLYERTLTLMWGAIINRVPDPFAWMDAFHLLVALAVIIIVVTAVCSLFAAVGMFTGARFGRTMGLWAAALGLMTSPPGAALGAFTAALLIRSDY